MRYSNATLEAASRQFSEAPHRLQEMASNVSEHLHDLGSNAGEMASEYYDQGRRALRRSATSLHDVIEDQPIRSTLVALGIGCLLCACLMRR